MDSFDLITVTEIVEQYGVSRRTIQRWVTDKKLTPTHTLPGQTGAHLFTRASAEEAFGNHRKRSTETSAS